MVRFLARLIMVGLLLVLLDEVGVFPIIVGSFVALGTIIVGVFTENSVVGIAALLMFMAIASKGIGAKG